LPSRGNSLSTTPRARPGGILSCGWLVAKSTAPDAYRCYWFAIPLRRWPLPRPCGFPCRAAHRTWSERSDASLRLGSTSESSYSYRAATVRVNNPVATPLLGFGSLQHLPAPESTIRGVSKSRYVPPSGFHHPLDGLLLPTPGRASFIPTALLGFSPSKDSPSRWSRTRFRAASPACRYLAARFRRVNSTGRHDETRLPGVVPAESPWPADDLLSRDELAPSLGFDPPGRYRTHCQRLTPPTPPTRFPQGAGP